MEDYRDVHHNSDTVLSYLDNIKSTSMSTKQKKNIEEFIRLLRLGKIGKKVGNRKITNYLQFILRLHEYFGKDLDSITEKECEKFYEDLGNNVIKKKNGMPYSKFSKDEWVKTLKRYLGWKWGNASKKYVKGLRWMRDTGKKSEKKAITLQECEKIIAKEPNPRNKALFMFLFDSGARIEEALNVRIKDIKKSEKSKNPFFIVHLRGQKTEEADRIISIPLCSKTLNQWLKKHPTKESEDYLFPLQYDNARKIVRLMSTAGLGYKLKPHELRHSSATHYIQNGGFGSDNIGGFYYRYGWKFGSDVALIYIKSYMYAGEAPQEKVVQHIVSDRIEKLESTVEEQRQIIESLNSHIIGINKGMKELYRRLKK